MIILNKNYQIDGYEILTEGNHRSRGNQHEQYMSNTPRNMIVCNTSNYINGSSKIARIKINNNFGNQFLMSFIVYRYNSTITKSCNGTASLNTIYIAQQGENKKVQIKSDINNSVKVVGEINSDVNIAYFDVYVNHLKSENVFVNILNNGDNFGLSSTKQLKIYTRPIAYNELILTENQTLYECVDNNSSYLNMNNAILTNDEITGYSKGYEKILEFNSSENTQIFGEIYNTFDVGMDSTKPLERYLKYIKFVINIFKDSDNQYFYELKILENLNCNPDTLKLIVDTSSKICSLLYTTYGSGSHIFYNELFSSGAYIKNKAISFYGKTIPTDGINIIDGEKYSDITLSTATDEEIATHIASLYE